MRTAVYAGTRNVYGDIETALKSLLYNTKVDRVYLLTEDDELPFSAELPEYVKVINVANQTYIRKDSPNYDTPWTYMALVRAALTKILPDEDRVLSLDIDTIVDKNIGELLDVDMNGCYIAGVNEPEKQGFPQPYVNCGVLVMDLRLLREIDDKILHSLNTEYTFANEQDVFNKMCRGRIKLLPSRYNASSFSAPCGDPKIIHFAGIGEHLPWSRRRWQDSPLVQKYKRISWEEIKCRNT